MEHYFVTHSSARQKALTDAGIAFTHLAIKGEKGLVFEDRVSATALSAMRLDIERTRQSSYEGIKILYVKRARRNRTGEPTVPAPIPTVSSQVVVSAWDHADARSTEEDFIAVAKEFSTVFGVRKIVLKSCREGTFPERPRSGTGDLNIFIWSAASGTSQSDSEHPGLSPTHLFGFKISDYAGNWRFWLPSGQGTVIQDSAGLKVAEVVGENLYIHYCIDSYKIERASRVGIFRRILEEAALLKNLAPEELVKRRAEAVKQEQLRIQAEALANPVKVERWNSGNAYRQKFIEVAKEFVSPLGGKQIFLYDFSHSFADHQAPHEDGRFSIRISASPADLVPMGRIGTKLFGAPLHYHRDGDSSLYAAANGYSGWVEMVDEDGSVVGGLVGDNLYINYPLPRDYLRLQWDGKGPEVLFRRILEEAVFLRTATEKQKAARAREISIRVRARSREEYSKMCGGRIDAEIESAKKVIENSPTKVTEYQQAIVKLIREVDRSKELLAEHERFRDRAAEKYVAEFDKLVTIEKVRDVRVADGKVLQVFTDTLYCTDPRTKKVHEIGHFRIEIDPLGRVRWHNLARKVNGYESQMNAPHVYRSGEACLGSIAEIVPDLIAKYEFAALTMVCISFIESVNVEDGAGKNINLWPLAAMPPKK